MYTTRRARTNVALFAPTPLRPWRTGRPHDVPVGAPVDRAQEAPLSESGTIERQQRDWRLLADLSHDFGTSHADLGFPPRGAHGTAGSGSASGVTGDANGTQCVENLATRVRALLTRTNGSAITHTRPAVVETVLARMLLHEHVPTRALLADLLHSPQPLQPLLDSMTRCAAANPLLARFACVMVADQAVNVSLRVTGEGAAEAKATYVVPTSC